MHKFTKLLTAVGIGAYTVGMLLNFWNSFVEMHNIFSLDSEYRNTEYIKTSLGLIAVSILINLIITGILGFFIYVFFKRKTRKSAVWLCTISGVIMLFTAVLTLLNFTPAMPKYLLYSRLDVIGTYILYFMPLLKSGIILRFIALIFMFTAVMTFIFQKRKKENEA